MKLVLNKRSGAVVMSSDSEGLGVESCLNYIFFLVCYYIIHFVSVDFASSTTPPLPTFWTSPGKPFRIYSYCLKIIVSIFYQC